MLSLLPILEGVIERGLLFSLVVVAVYLTSRIIKFDDLSVEGSFGIGGAVTAACLAHDISIIIALPLALLAGALTGMATGLLHTKLKLNNLMSGIIVTTGLFSIALKLASSNVGLSHATTLFTYAPHTIIVLIIISVLIAWGVLWLLHTEVGYMLYAVGSNERILTTLGKNIDTYKIGCLMLANSITALAGSLFVQLVGYFSIWSNVGMLIIAMTGLILSEMITTHITFWSLLLGSILYQGIIAATFEFQLDPSWNKLITALLLVALLSIKQLRK
ncbi:MAG: hypothetical protein AB7F19_02555 [Candidatus Babeliales bacterium]